MPMVNPDDFQPEDMARLIRRMADAGWLKGGNTVVDYNVSLDFTALGVQRMLALIELMKPYAPEFFGLPPGTPKCTDLMKFHLASLTLAPEMVSVTFSRGEANALSSLIGGFFLKNRPDGQPPLDPKRF